MAEYRSDEYSDFEASAFAQLSCSVFDDDETVYAAECSPLEECDQAFEKLYSSATFSEDDMPLPAKGPKKKISIWRSNSNRSQGSSSSLASDQSRASCQSGQKNSSMRSSPRLVVRRTQSHNNTTAVPSPGKILRPTMPIRAAQRGKSCDALQDMATRHTASLSKSLPRRVFRFSSSSTKMTYPEDRSFNETLRAAANTDCDDSDSTVYFDNSQCTSDECSEFSEEFENGSNGPPVFLVEAALRCAHDSLNSSALMYGSIHTLSFERDGELEI